MKNLKTVVSPWLSVAILLLGITFLAFVLIEYQRNTNLVEQNKHLLAESVKSRLTNQLLKNTVGKNWAKLKDDYRWIKTPPKDYWFDNGEQQFPWHRRKFETPHNKDNDWSEIWSEIDALSEPKLVNPQRFALLIKISEALSSKNPTVIRQSFNSYVEHKNAFQLSPLEEVAFSLKLVEIGAEEHWSPELVHAILLTGGPDDAPIFRPLADLLMRHCDQFSEHEIKTIVSVIKAQLEGLNLTAFYLDEYVQHMLAPRFPALPETQLYSLRSSTLINERWLLTHLGNKLVRFQALDLTQNIQQLEKEFMQLGVLNVGDSISVADLLPQHPLADIVINVDKQQLTDDRRNQAWYLAIKSTMLIAFMLLILLTLRLIEKNQQRKLEYIALKEDFVKLVSHELKTPLAGIRAMAETLRKRIERELDVQTYPERIVSEADKLWYMVDNILGFNRVQMAQVVIDQQAAKLKTLCDNIVSDAQTFSSKRYVIQNTIDATAEEHIDIELFSLVLKNIVVNASLYNNNQTIELKLSYDSQARYLAIFDNGIGVPKADHQKVFKPFVRLTQSVRQSGTGLGLALCKKIMQLHNGDLTLAESSNKGSLWKITFTK